MKRDIDAVVTEIKREINDDPTIAGASHILVYKQKKGLFGKTDIVIGGTVHNDSDKSKAEEHAQHAAGGIVIVNNIEVVKD